MTALTRAQRAAGAAGRRIGTAGGPVNVFFDVTVTRRTANSTETAPRVRWTYKYGLLIRFAAGAQA